MGRKGFRKFGNIPVVFDGIRFDSQREMGRYVELKHLEKCGVISHLKLQVPIMLEGRDGPLLTRTGRKMRLTVDFTYTDTVTGLTIFEDAKGKPTRDYEVRKAVAGAMGIAVVEV